MEEKKIPHYINDPVINRLTAPENKLYRPIINFKKAIIVTVGTVIGTMIMAYIVSLLVRYLGLFGWEKMGQLQVFVNIYWITQLLVLLLTLKYILIWFIRVYQRYAKSETRLRCCYIWCTYWQH